MVYYSEVGIGNNSLFSTEIESNGLEYRVKGWIVGRVISWYVRIWIGNKVLILDSIEGIKIGNKERKLVKFLIGVKSIG